MSIANELITRGWVQGSYESGGHVCLVGACIKSEVATNDAVQAVADVLGVPGRRVIGWNDAPGRTFDEVLRVAKEADEILGAL